MTSIFRKYFPELTGLQEERFNHLPALYSEWNEKINVISRKDIEHLPVHHILHSLSIARVVTFADGTKVLDVGTGGGFPGIPLAILFPGAEFLLTDSIGKKIKVVHEIAGALGLDNVRAIQARAEDLKGSYDFITGRAVTALPEFTRFVAKKLSRCSVNSIPNGILYLKGGEFGDELQGIRGKVTVYNLSEWFSEDYFETKKLVHIVPLPM